MSINTRAPRLGVLARESPYPLAHFFFLKPLGKSIRENVKVSPTNQKKKKKKKKHPVAHWRQKLHTRKRFFFFFFFFFYLGTLSASGTRGRKVVRFLSSRAPWKVLNVLPRGFPGEKVKRGVQNCERAPPLHTSPSDDMKRIVTKRLE